MANAYLTPGNSFAYEKDTSHLSSVADVHPRLLCYEVDPGRKR